MTYCRIVLRLKVAIAQQRKEIVQNYSWQMLFGFAIAGEVLEQRRFKHLKTTLKNVSSAGLKLRLLANKVLSLNRGSRRRLTCSSF